jgi:hypothetical protein
VPLAVTHFLTVCTIEPPDVTSRVSRHRLRPATPDTSAAAWKRSACGTDVAGLGLANMEYDVPAVLVTLAA